MENHPGFNLLECSEAEQFWQLMSPQSLLEPPPSRFIYRGQRDASWGLQPLIYRKGNAVSKIFGRDEVSADERVFGEIRILEHFAFCCDSLGLKVPKDSVEFRNKHLNSQTCDAFYLDPTKWPNEELIEFLALAQHHGLPTRLLDWTTRSYVAAYFAVSDAMSKPETLDKEKKIAVWALNIEGISLYPNVKIIRVPGSTSVNLAAQNGVFTLLKQQGRRGEPFSERTLEQDFQSLRKTPLWKITLPHDRCHEILKLCELYGVSAATLFPGYDGAARSVLDSINLWDKTELVTEYRKPLRC